MTFLSKETCDNMKSRVNFRNTIKIPKFIDIHLNSGNPIEMQSKTRKATYPYCVSANGTSMLCDARRRSLAMSANLAKSVSESAKRAERRDSSKRTSSKRIFKSVGGYSREKKNRK